MENAQGETAKFLDPEKIISQLDVKAGDVVADFGCGPGYFTLPFAKKVEVGGKVYALDVLPQALETVESKKKNFGVANIVPMRVNLEKENGSKLYSDCADWVILKDMLFQNQKRMVIIAEVRRVLKEGGKVLAIEWNEKSSAIGPEKNMRIPEGDLKKMFAENELEVRKDIDAGDFHYAFVAVKK